MDDIIAKLQIDNTIKEVVSTLNYIKKEAATYEDTYNYVMTNPSSPIYRIDFEGLKSLAGTKHGK